MLRAIGPNKEVSIVGHALERFVHSRSRYEFATTSINDLYDMAAAQVLNNEATGDLMFFEYALKRYVKGDDDAGTVQEEEPATTAVS